jgi:alkylhydroperoxidase family enzyme
MRSALISRLPPIDEDAAQGTLAEIYAGIRAAGRRILNIHRVSGHAPQLFKAHVDYATALRQQVSLPRALVELIVLRTAQVANSPYEISVHIPMALACGIPHEKIDTLAAWRPSALFDAKERAVLAYVEQMAGDGEVDDATFAELARLFTPQEILEITETCSYYLGNTRFVKALRIRPENAG